LALDQLSRSIHIEFTLIFAVLLLEAVGWRYTATPQPTFKVMDQTKVNPVLLFAIDGLVILGLAVLQVTFYVWDKYQGRNIDFLYSFSSKHFFLNDSTETRFYNL
jgi:hypothetical protein